MPVLSLSAMLLLTASPAVTAPAATQADPRALEQALVLVQQEQSLEQEVRTLFCIK